MQYTVGVDGMMCGMCEAHIQDAIRKAFPDAAKVKASRKKGNVTFISDGDVTEDLCKKTIENTGYTFTGYEASEKVKRGLFG